MLTTFQELKIGDEFIDETNIMYRKIHDNAFCGPRHETTAMVINHGVLGGTELLIHPGQTVNKIVRLIKVEDMKYGDVFVFYSSSHHAFYYVKLNNSKQHIELSDVINLERREVSQFRRTDELEVVGHINLVWPQ